MVDHLQLTKSLDIRRFYFNYETLSEFRELLINDYKNREQQIKDDTAEYNFM